MTIAHMKSANISAVDRLEASQSLIVAFIILLFFMAYNGQWTTDH